MSKKPKIDKRLDKFFKGITPEESNSKSKDNLNVRKEVLPPPADSLNASGTRLTLAREKTETVSSPRPLKSLAPALVPPEPVITLENENTTSSYSSNIQTGYQDWSTLRVLDETIQRQLTQDEELLVKQVSDQLSLALENANLFQAEQRRASELNTLAEFSRLISQNLDLEEVYTTAYELIGRLMPTESFFINLLNPDKSEFTAA